MSQLEEKESFSLGVLLHSFFVIPFIIAVIAVLLFTGIKLLTAENRTVFDYLKDISEGGKTKRWQAAFELSKILSNEEECPRDDLFRKQMLNVYKQSEHDDIRVRKYLALAMGRSKDVFYKDVLVESLLNKEEKATVATIYALGLLKLESTVAVLSSFVLSKHKEERLAVALALGDIGGDDAQRALLPLLNDEEPNVVWETAVALAKNKNKAGKSILLSMLTRNYWKKFNNVDKKEQNQAIVVAIKAAALLGDEDINKKIRLLGEQDSNIIVKRVAKEVLDKNIVK